LQDFYPISERMSLDFFIFVDFAGFSGNEPRRPGHKRSVPHPSAPFAEGWESMHSGSQPRFSFAAST